MGDPLVEQLIRIFQYPRADRGECNLNVITKLHRPRIPFSILVQIVGSATTKLPIPLRRGSDFQYPRADRGECNAAGSTWPGLNLSHLSVSSCRSWGVQLAKATELTPPPKDTFSILVQIVGSATDSARRWPPRGWPLSVSSCRSWGVQHTL